MLFYLFGWGISFTTDQLMWTAYSVWKLLKRMVLKRTEQKKRSLLFLLKTTGPNRHLITLNLQLRPSGERRWHSAERWVWDTSREKYKLLEDPAFCTVMVRHLSEGANIFRDPQVVFSSLNLTNQKPGKLKCVLDLRKKDGSSKVTFLIK